MAKIARLSSEQRENLTAYLDGELDESATQQIEQVLAVSEVARHEVDMLSRTWDMLGVLPAHKASDQFTHQTMTNLRASEQTGPGAVQMMVYRNLRRGIVLAAWTGAVCLCGYVGFLATNRWVPNESVQLLDDYSVVENLDKYTEVGSIEFLRVLKSKHTFSEHDDQPEK